MPAIRIEAVVFDMDGVLVDTKHLWDEVREELTAEWGGRYTPEAQHAMMGMSSREWSRYLNEVVGLREPPDVINEAVVRAVLARYEVDLPVVPGAVEAVRRIACRAGFPAGARLVVEPRADQHGAPPTRGVAELFEAGRCRPRRSPRGKPAPDVYLEAAARLGVDPARCVAVEDSASGIRSAHAAGMRVIAYPNRHYPPGRNVLALASRVVVVLGDLISSVQALR